MSMPRPSFDPMQQAQQLFTGHHGWLLSRLKARLRNTAEAQDVAADDARVRGAHRSRRLHELQLAHDQDGGAQNAGRARDVDDG